MIQFLIKNTSSNLILLTPAVPTPQIAFRGANVKTRCDAKLFCKKLRNQARKASQTSVLIKSFQPGEAMQNAWRRDPFLALRAVLNEDK